MIKYREFETAAATGSWSLFSMLKKFLGFVLAMALLSTILFPYRPSEYPDDITDLNQVNVRWNRSEFLLIEQ